MPDTFYGGTLKGGGRLSQQPFLDPYAKVGVAQLSDRKPSLTAAALLTDQVVPCFATPAVPLRRLLTERGTE